MLQSWTGLGIRRAEVMSVCLGFAEDNYREEQRTEKQHPEMASSLKSLLNAFSDSSVLLISILSSIVHWLRSEVPAPKDGLGNLEVVPTWKIAHGRLQNRRPNGLVWLGTLAWQDGSPGAIRIS
jgi:hypothetical protein